MGACAVITEQLAATIKVARLHEQVVELSLTDALTNLYNRRYFEIVLKNEISRSQRFARGLSLILVDCDNFKEYNDTYGHPAGDEALQQVGKCLSLGRQNADIVARIGGDEFVVVLPETELKGAFEVSKKIRAAVNRLTHLKCPITVSIGMAGFCKDMTEDELIQQADMALYESKRKGKNRISFFDNKQIFDEKDFPVL
jgi:diguanylate cyclase (GGDEF)-like protein